MDNLQRIAVLIDADNTQLGKLEDVLSELSTYGRIVVKRAYGNWKKPALKNWEAEVKRLAIKAEQQFDFAFGKNATDIALTIDAMDMLHEDIYDAFALVSSDSDFTPLAIRLRGSGAYIIGAGENKTPEAFRNACDDFILLEYVGKKEPTKKDSTAHGAPSAIVPPTNSGSSVSEEIHNLLRLAFDKYQNDEGFANVASAGQFMKRVKPDFIPLTYGYSKLPELIAAFPDRYEMKRFKGKGTVTIVAYRCL